MNEEEANMMMAKDGEIARLGQILKSEQDFQDILEKKLRENCAEMQGLESTSDEKDEMIIELQEELCEQDKKIAELQAKENRVSKFFRRFCFKKRRSPLE